MQTSVEPQGVPKKKLPPLVIVFAIIFVLCALFLIIPSSRSSRVTQAKARLDRNFPKVPLSDIKPLYGGYLLDNQDAGGNHVKESHSAFLYVFAPSPTAPSIPSPTQIFIDFSNRYSSYNRGDTQCAILFAPDPGSTGWTLLAQDWIAYSLKEKNVGELKVLGQELSYPTGTTSPQTKLKKIWNSFSPEIQRQAEDILTKNRAIAKQIGNNRRFYQDGKGLVYELSPGSDNWDFMNTYEQAFPSAPPPKRP